jgi:hypothetical protein
MELLNCSGSQLEPLRFPRFPALVDMALRNLEKRWDRSIRDWTKTLGQFAIFFPGRLPAA